MGTQRERFETWFPKRRGSREPRFEAALLDVADAYDAIEASEDLAPKHLKVIVDAASHQRALLWENATELLGKLSERWRLAAEAIEQMFASRQSHVRFNALCSLTSKTPCDTVDRLLRAGLADKSSRVRWKAAQQAGRFGKTELVPELESAMAAETKEKARAQISLELCLLRDGHIVEPAPDSGCYVTVRVKRGIRTGYISDGEMKAKGIERIAAEFRAQR